MDIKKEINNKINDPSYSFSISEKNWLSIFLQLTSNECFETIMREVDTTIDRSFEIQTHDIPNIIISISTILQKESEKIEMKNGDNIFILIQLTIYTIIESGKYNIPNIPQMNQLDSTILNCLELLKMNIIHSMNDSLHSSKKQWCFGFF